MSQVATTKIAWTIAASDSSGGAGIQADLATFAHFKVHGCSILTKITAQNTQGISKSSTVSDDIFIEQLSCLNIDLPADTIKISVLGSEKQLNYLCDFLSAYPGFSVYDPVFISSNNSILTQSKLSRQICQQLLPNITLITPNIHEAEFLTKTKITTYQDILIAGKILLQLGVKNVLIKGGHFNSDFANDLFMNDKQYFWLVNKKQLFSHNIHGTGCHLSSAIAANIALGFNLVDSIIIAKRYLNSALRVCNLLLKDTTQYYIPQFSFNFNHTDMPVIVNNHLKIDQLFNYKFLDCDAIGLYPVVNNSNWVKILAKAGVKSIQLRIKDVSIAEVEQEIIQSIVIANASGINLFINDYWELAIKHKAYGVHLGQEDLLTANIAKIKSNNLRLGISTHNHFELAVALSYQPSYIALGPIFQTTSKIMPWAPQGINKLKEWRVLLHDKCQLVAIGGINLSNINDIIVTGINNIALISGITTASDPYQMSQELLGRLKWL